MRLIDADKLHYIRKWFEDSGKSEVVVFAKEIDKAPTVDAVPVIRCKDCKWYEMSEEETFCRELGIFNTEPTSYCSYAKRKEE